MRHYKEFDLTEYNSYRLKSKCANAFFPDNEDEMRYIFSHGVGRKKVLLGHGNNVILSKKYYSEDFIILSNNFNQIYISDTIIEAEAGATLLRMSELASEKSLTGLEIFYDIPGSIGGAVVMNAGANGEAISDVLMKVRYYDSIKDEFKEIQNAAIGFDYRNSCFQKNTDLIITKAWFQLRAGNSDQINLRMEKIRSERWVKQPRNYPNAGSVFKRPTGYYVGEMIDELGLKGFTIGGAKISEKHSGFIINFKDAQGEDIINLIETISLKVYQKYNIYLELEQKIL
jgi:UDP-N-acetylmuramate dehydrogenase